MNQPVTRTESVAPVAKVQTRSMNAVPAASASGSGDNEGSRAATQRPTATANYARIQADIAQALKAVQDRQPAPSADDLGNAERAMLDLMPTPVVVLPMPPTDPDMVAFVAQVAQSLAQQAVRTHAAQARIAASTIDALVA